MPATPSVPETGTSISRPRFVVLVTLNLALVALGLWFIGANRAPHPPQPPATGPASVRAFSVPPTSAPVDDPLPSLGETVEPDGTVQTSGPCSLALEPNRLVIPSLCVDGPVIATPRTSEGALVIPSDVDTIGRWDDGAPLAGTSGPAGAVGTTLLAGHLTYPGQGKGALYHLGSIRPRDLVYTVDSQGTVARWRIVALAEVHKDRLPPVAFAGRTGDRRLVIVTCGGPIVHVHGYGATYRDNVIATAVPA